MAIRRPNRWRELVEKVLVPTPRPGDIVIMDNLGAPKAKAARQLIAAGAMSSSFCLKYSPNLNPIEQVFTKITS
jgi:transposase